MDIFVTCDKCGKNIVVDEGAAGFTIDCPQCGRAVYVSSVVPKPKDAPVRVEIKPPRHDPLVPTYESREKPDIHPSIQAGVHCLLVLVAIEIIGFLAIRQNMLWADIFLFASTPFVFAPLLCAVYGMCAGHVRDGLSVLGGLALILAISCWLIFAPLLSPNGQGMQQILKPFLR